MAGLRRNLLKPNGLKVLSKASPKILVTPLNTYEILTALTAMTTSEQLEVLEVSSKIIRERLTVKTDLEIAAEKMQVYYAKGSDLAAFTDDNNEDFYEYSGYTHRLNK